MAGNIGYGVMDERFGFRNYRNGITALVLCKDKAFLM